MPFHLLDVVKAKSKLELARRIRAVWKHLAPRDKVPAAVAISNRLGDLEKDRDAWWLSEERHAARQAFEQVTGVAFRDLPLARSFAPSPDFPKLRPLRPGADEPLPLATPDWFERPGTRADRHWIVAPPGSGRSLAVQWHRIRGSARAEEVQSLADAVELVGVDAPLLVSIDGPPTATDAASLQRLARRGELTVIATYPPPFLADDRDAPWESNRQSKKIAEQEGWFVEPWTRVAEWRELLVRSIADRIEDRETLFDPEQALSWLEANDPRQETVATPGDVVSLCAMIHQAGVGAFRRDIVSSFLQARVKGDSAQDGASTIWLRAWGTEVLRSNMKARLHDVALPLWAPLPVDRWRTLVAGELAPLALSETEIDRLLDRKRTPVREARRLLRRRSGPEVIELLRDTRILRPQGSGLVLHPRWIGLAIAREAVRTEIQGGASATWGRWSVDADRRPIVDSELDHLPFKDLEQVAARVCASFDPAALGAVGAVEAVFAAVGRRLGPSSTASPDLLALWELQRELLAPRYADDTPFPVTRPGVERGSDWIACCWRWSLHGPRTSVEDRLAWLFPGWASPTLAALAPLAHKSVDEPGWGGDTEPRGSFAQLLEMTDDVVCRATDTSLPANLPAFVVPAILLAAHHRSPRWRLSRDHVSNLAGRAWTSAHVAARVAALGPEDRAEVASTLWTAALDGGGGVRAALDAFRDDVELLEVVTRDLRTDDFATSLSPTDVNALERLHALPARLRLALVEYALRAAPAVTHDLDRLVDDVLWRGRRAGATITDDDLPWMEVIADHGRARAIGRSRIWAMAPERTLARADAAPIDTADASDWFNSAPRHAYARLVQRLSAATADGHPLPTWATLWLRRRILDAGATADLAYDVLQRPSNR